MGRHVLRYNYYRVKDCTAARHQTSTEAPASKTPSCEMENAQSTLDMRLNQNNNNNNKKQNSSEESKWASKLIGSGSPRSSEVEEEVVHRLGDGMHSVHQVGHLLLRPDQSRPNVAIHHIPHTKAPSLVLAEFDSPSTAFLAGKPV